jgi:5-methyltetrahydropteroyltriglutamate--homocysteine methyltransferase
MKRSRDRILTTHVGSLPRSAEVVDLLRRKEHDEPYDKAAFDRAIKQRVAEVVDLQSKLGIEVVSDGETSKIGYSTYIRERLSGFGGEFTPKPNRDLADYPEFSKRMAAFLGPRPFRRTFCVAPVTLKDPDAVQIDVANFRAALASKPDVEGFLNAASPGVVASFQPNQYYPTPAAYLEAIADALTPEYEAIAGAGFLLQVDCPDLAMSRHTGFQEMSEAEFLKQAELQVEALNHALARVSKEQVRIHICWGNYEGPHDHDIALERIMPLIRKVKATAISFEAANARHEHEWIVWRDAKLPEETILMPGVLDTSSNYVEHPELVAQRIERFAACVGRERVIASTDCGFGTFAGYSKVDPGIALKKLQAMAEGAAIASRRLWK